MGGVLERDLRVLHVTLGRERRAVRSVLREVVAERCIETVDFAGVRERLSGRAPYDVVLLDADGESQVTEDAFAALAPRAVGMPIVVATDDDASLAARLVTLGAAEV